MVLLKDIKIIQVLQKVCRKRLPTLVLYHQLNVLRAITIRDKWLNSTPVRPSLYTYCWIKNKINLYQYPVQ